MLSFRAFVCLFGATTAVFSPQTVSSQVVLSLLFSAHSDGLSFFCACSEPPVMKRCNCLSPVSTHRVPCSFCSSAAVQRSFLGNTVTA